MYPGISEIAVGHVARPQKEEKNNKKLDQRENNNQKVRPVRRIKK